MVCNLSMLVRSIIRTWEVNQTATVGESPQYGALSQAIRGNAIKSLKSLPRYWSHFVPCCESCFILLQADDGDTPLPSGTRGSA